MTDLSRPKPSMSFEGYIERIDFHFERLGVEARPSQQEYVEAWNNQIPAKKMAQTFARRQGEAQTRDEGLEHYGIIDGEVPWHLSGKEDRPGFSMRSMGFDGYRTQVGNRLRQYGWEGEPPSDRYLHECLSNQTCAKRAASSWMRRSRKLKKR